MNQYILVINAGSSSIKFRLYDHKLIEIANGLCERIGIDGNFKMTHGNQTVTNQAPFPNHSVTLDYLLNALISANLIADASQIKGIGHRIVQGGAITSSCVVDNNVLNEIHANIALAPLHNKPEYDVLKATMAKFPTAQNVAVFDTSFHTTIPPLNKTYAVPQEWVTKHQVQKYGFHGTSYRYVTEQMATILNKPQLNLIVCHLGNGASICCIKNNQSYDTTMGLTPLTGLVMGTRSGDVDPSLFELLKRQANLSPEVVFDMLNKQAGLKALCGMTDFRDISANKKSNPACQFANDMFVQRIVNYIAIYQNMLANQIDALVFTGGIGENADDVRFDICAKVHGLSLDAVANSQKIGSHAKISLPESRYPIYVVRTNEELKIAMDTKALIWNN